MREKPLDQIWWAWDSEYPNETLTLVKASDRDRALVEACEVLDIPLEDRRYIEVERPFDQLRASRDALYEALDDLVNGKHTPETYVEAFGKAQKALAQARGEETP